MLSSNGRHRAPKVNRNRRTQRTFAGAGLVGLSLAATLGATASSASAATPAQAPAHVPAHAPVRALSVAPSTVASTVKAAAVDSSYTVVAGDWLSTIAQKSQVAGGWQRLYELNKSTLTEGPDLIYPGEVLRLGGALAPSTTSNDSAATEAGSDSESSTKASNSSDSVASSAPAAATTTVASTGSGLAAAIAFAQSQVGDAYVYGGTDSSGWDCSGLTQAALAKAGINIPRVAADQAAASTHVSLSNLQPGDLLFWSNDGTDAGVYHVGIYIGGGKYVEAANPSVGVHVETISNWAPDFAGRIS
jgi:cell wall-associated NlpC family hydrolase